MADELLDASRPGRTQTFADGSEWWVARRTLRPDGGNHVTLTVELVRTGSDADPRTEEARRGR